MNKIVCIFLLISTSIFSQKTLEKYVGDFQVLKVYNGLTVHLKKDSVASRLVITGEKADELIYKNVNGKLKLIVKFPKNFNGKGIGVTLYYRDSLTTIDGNGNSHIIVSDTIKQHSIALKTQEGSKIEAQLALTKLSVKSVTGGEVKVGGTAANQVIDASSGGTFKGYNLQSKAVTATAASGSVIQVTVSELLDSQVRAGGTVYYKGIPRQVIMDKIIGGTIESKDE